MYTSFAQYNVIIMFRIITIVTDDPYNYYYYCNAVQVKVLYTTSIDHSPLRVTPIQAIYILASIIIARLFLPKLVLLLIIMSPALD